MQFFLLKSGSRLLNYGQKTTLKQQTSVNLNFKMSYLFIWLLSSSIMLLYTKFYQNRIIFPLRYGDLTICNMADVGHLEFFEI